MRILMVVTVTVRFIRMTRGDASTIIFEYG